MSDIPEWAFNRAKVLAKDETFDGGYTRTHQAFARYIAEHEEPPVDPLLLEARQLVECTVRWSPQTDRDLLAGKNDSTPEVKIALAALKRGMELAREEKP